MIKKRQKTTPQKRKKQGKIYFTKDHENAIVEYAKTKDLKIRQKLYIEFIGPAFNEMVEKMVFTYKFTSLPNIDDLKDECKVWLTTILDKFDPSKGSKAFSYFSVITKNWFIHKVKKNVQQSKREVYFEELEDKSGSQSEMIVHNNYIQQRSNKEFWVSFWEEIDEWEKQDLKQNEKKVLYAIKMLLENPEKIEIFNKKAVYLYVREITGLNTKQIANNLGRLKEKYFFFRDGWDLG